MRNKILLTSGKEFSNKAYCSVTWEMYTAISIITCNYGSEWAASEWEGPSVDAVWPGCIQCFSCKPVIREPWKRCYKLGISMLTSGTANAINITVLIDCMPCMAVLWHHTSERGSPWNPIPPWNTILSLSLSIYLQSVPRPITCYNLWGTPHAYRNLTPLGSLMILVLVLALSISTCNQCQDPQPVIGCEGPAQHSPREIWHLWGVWRFLC